MNKYLLYELSILILVLVAGLLCYVYYLLFFPGAVIRPLEQPYKVQTHTVRAGGELTYVPNYCKSLDVPSQAQRSLVDGLVFALAPATSNLPAGCHKTPVTITIPKNIPPGVYHLELAITYHVNVLRTETYRFKTETFTVTH